jgi:multiple sugar transport system substrate-binding protein
MNKTLTRRGLLQGSAVAAALALGLTGCGGGAPAAQQTVSSNAVEEALQKGGKLTVWAWEPTLKKVVEGFEAKYPNVDVELVNAGTGNDQYTALQNAIRLPNP